ncbi:MAG: carbohydrate ABC transporter permease [Hyphomicrobiaceae bacterium]
MSAKFRFFSLGGQLVLIAAAALVVFAMFPFAWMATTAFKPSQEIFVTPPTLWPQEFTLANLERLFDETRFLVYFRNSLVVSFATVALTLFVAIPAAYSLTRFSFPGREKAAATILFTYMFAPIMIIVPFYVMMRFIGLTNTHFGLVLAYTAFCLPFNLWMLRTFFQSIPVDLEEAAMIDGASRFRAVRYVVVPLALPGVVATGIFTFILAWNDYIFARVLLSADELKTLPVGIADLYNAAVTDWGMIMAAGLLVITPVAGVFVFIQKYMVADWGGGGLKG